MLGKYDSLMGVIDQIGGWSKQSVKEGYGGGWNLDKCRCFLAKAIKQHKALAVSILKQEDALAEKRAQKHFKANNQ